MKTASTSTPDATGAVFLRLLLLTMLTAALVVLQPGAASACSCMAVTTAEMVAEAEIVFVGSEIGRVETNDAWPSVAVTYQVHEVYKGDVGPEITLWTGSGGGDCGVSAQTGPIGIAVRPQTGRPTIDICGSVHSPQAIAAELDPIEIAAPAPPEEPSGDTGMAPWLWAGGIGVAAVAGLVAWRRRGDDWQDGWNSSA